MNTYLLLWNPANFSWLKPECNEDIIEDVAMVKKGKCIKRWNCGVLKSIKTGDRIFLQKLGTDKKDKTKGIIASGHAITTPFENPHYSIPGKKSLYIDINIDSLLNPYVSRILTLEELEMSFSELPNRYWTPISAKSVNQDIANKLESLWKKFV